MKDKKLKSKKKATKDKKSGKKVKSLKKKPQKSKMGQEVKEALECVLEQEKKESNVNSPMGFEILMKQAANKHDFIIHDTEFSLDDSCQEPPKTWYQAFMDFFTFKKKP